MRRALPVFMCLLLVSCAGDENSIMGPEPSPRPSCVPAPSGVVSWWPGDGSNRDVVGTNHLELENGATYGPGVVGQGFALDAVDDYAGGEADGIEALQQLSIEAWVRLDQLMEEEQRMVTLGPKAALSRFRSFARFFININGEFTEASRPDVLEQGVFHHIAGTFGGSFLRLYVDGELVGGAPASGTLASTDHVVLAGDQSPLGGIIDEITVYDRALTPSEVRAIFEAGSDGKCIP